MGKGVPWLARAPHGLEAERFPHLPGKGQQPGLLPAGALAWIGAASHPSGTNEHQTDTQHLTAPSGLQLDEGVRTWNLRALLKGNLEA